MNKQTRRYPVSDEIIQSVLEDLQQQLDTLKAQEPLPQPGTPESLAMERGAWASRFDTLTEQGRMAYVIALQCAPTDVRQMVERVNRQVRRLQGISLPWDEQEDQR